ncbi:R3H domain-containing nucleic acid-binding protein [Sporichthya sp.]|uniref:Jag family protein n=1 Tax=Sporichthya sp. TaxID=65475 RepID=UPI001805D97A|nr:R3H domain-containing nucleic acid-binding protein [Sporichthya sp.]MBA3741686.1 single-stranded DNA-binding protein [Sporichthya sp.]
MSQSSVESAVDDLEPDEGAEAVELDEGTEEGADEGAEESEGGRRRGPRKPSKARLVELEQEGEIAADYLEGLLDIADLDGDIDMDVEGDRAAVSIVGADLKQLVGKDGQVLEAVQELTRLAVLRATGERSRLMLDIGGFRAARREELTELGTKTADEVKSTGTSVKLAPMTPFERKIVHDAIADAGLRSESEGEEPSRRVVVHPA